MLGKNKNVRMRLQKSFTKLYTFMIEQKNPYL